MCRSFIGNGLQQVAHLEPWLPLERSSIVIDVAVVIQDVDELQTVTLANQEIIGVMGRGDLHSTWGRQQRKEAVLGAAGTGWHLSTAGLPCLGYHSRCNLCHCRNIYVLWQASTCASPVPNSMSTSSASAMIGMQRLLTGWATNLPCKCLYL